MVAVICWPFCGARRNTSILAGPCADFVELQHRLQIGWVFFRKHKVVLTNQHIALHLRLKIVCCRHLSCNLVWFGYPALDQNWQSLGEQITAENVSIHCWLGKVWRWRLVRYHAPDELEIVFAMTIRECKPWSSQIFQASFALQPKYSVSSRNSCAAAASKWNSFSELATFSLHELLLEDDEDYYSYYYHHQSCHHHSYSYPCSCSHSRAWTWKSVHMWNQGENMWKLHRTPRIQEVRQVNATRSKTPWGALCRTIIFWSLAIHFSPPKISKSPSGRVCTAMFKNVTNIYTGYTPCGRLTTPRHLHLI